MKDPEKVGDRLLKQGKFRLAAEAYSQCYKPYRGYPHLVRIVKKQTEAMRRYFKEPKNDH